MSLSKSGRGGAEDGSPGFDGVSPGRTRGVSGLSGFGRIGRTGTTGALLISELRLLQCA